MAEGLPASAGDPAVYLDVPATCGGACVINDAADALDAPVPDRLGVELDTFVSVDAEVVAVSVEDMLGDGLLFASGMALELALVVTILCT